MVEWHLFQKNWKDLNETITEWSSDNSLPEFYRGNSSNGLAATATEHFETENIKTNKQTKHILKNCWTC